MMMGNFAKILPHFPDGRIDYSHASKAPVVIIFVKHKGKILLLKRSSKVRAYKGKWQVVAGYLDEVKPLREKTERGAECGGQPLIGWMRCAEKPKPLYTI